MTCWAVERTCVSEVPLAMMKKSVMSDTPLRSSMTTSRALLSTHSWAARSAAAFVAGVADGGCEVLGIEFGILSGSLNPSRTLRNGRGSATRKIGTPRGSRTTDCLPKSIPRANSDRATLVTLHLEDGKAVTRYTRMGERTLHTLYGVTALAWSGRTSSGKSGWRGAATLLWQ